MTIWEFIFKQFRSVAYASAGGSIVIGGAVVDIINADPITIMYMVGSAVLFNILKELVKVKKNGKDKT